MKNIRHVTPLGEWRSTHLHITATLTLPPSYTAHIPSSDEGKKIACRRPKVNFPCFGKKAKKPECWLEMHKSDYLSLTAEEQKRLRKEKDWKKILEGRHGKSIIQKQTEWERGLRQYDESSSWQRHIGEDTRKRHRDKLYVRFCHFLKILYWGMVADDIS